MEQTKLVLMDTGMFCEGMHVKSCIYYLYNGAYVLFCRDVTFTKDLIDRLRNAAKTTNGVFVEEEHYEEVWNESLRQYALDSSTYAQEYKKVKDEYNHVLSKTVDFLNNTRSNNNVPLEYAATVSDSISDEINSLDQALMLRCINMIHKADNYLYTHCVNVATLNGMVGKWMNLPEEEVKRLIKIGLVHDLGKLKIPPEILHKPGRLTTEEFEQIKQHSILSYNMLLQSGENDPQILQGVRQHHEKPNGTGYPDAISNQDICLAARITSVCDVYDAMVSKRCYKDASTPFEILAQFKENRFSHLDLEVVDIFLENITYLFIGMRIKLSNGEEGEVVFVRPTDYANPVVKVGNHIFTTSDTCKCTTAYTSL